MTNKFKILDSITESMAIIDQNGEIIFTNKAWRMFSDENRGDHSCTGVHNNYLTTCETVEGEETKMARDANKGIKQVIKGELNIFELEYPCHSPTENRWFILRASTVSTDTNLTLLAHINITNRKLAELEVEKNYSQSLNLNERLNTTLYKIVHDIQNPLFGIMGLADLSKSESDTETLNEYLEMIEKGSSDLSTFVKETLEHISTSNEVESLNVKEVTNTYLESVSHLLKSNNIEIQLDITQNEEFIVNAIEFRSIISNLIGNAIKYCDQEKSNKYIKVTFSILNGKANLKVKDNGVGIKEADLPKLLDKSYQVNKSSSEGAGLGLFMVKKSIDKINGTIQINSTFGEETEFIVELPQITK